VLEDSTDVLYKTTDYYAPDCEASIIWNDPDLNIQWPEAFTADRLLLSEKDLSAARFKNAKVFD
jgi:dTDP-4-dehydrorhamnose 3,5-epimerase